MAWRVDKTNHPEKFTLSSTVGALGLCAIALRCRALRTFVKCRISISNLDGNASSKLFAMSAGPDSCDGFDKSRLAMVDVA